MENLTRGLCLTSSNQLWVSDITYIPLANGDVCYLHLITDAYSHKIMGWVLTHTLRVSATIDALRQAIRQAVEMKGSESLTGLIHHSDRGVQYCCDQYVSLLQAHGIAVSMTEDYKPTDNAVAERVNGIIKVERVYRQRYFNGIEHARKVIERYIHYCWEIGIVQKLYSAIFFTEVSLLHEPYRHIHMCAAQHIQPDGHLAFPVKGD